MAASQTTAQGQSTQTTNLIQKLAGQSFDLSAKFEQGGYASFTLDVQSPAAVITNIRASEGLVEPNSSLTVTLLASQPGVTTATMVVSPSGKEPILVTTDYRIEVEPINT